MDSLSIHVSVARLQWILWAIHHISLIEKAVDWACRVPATSILAFSSVHDFIDVEAIVPLLVGVVVMDGI